MKSKIFLSIKGGFVATLVMSVLIYLSPALGFPRMPVWEVLADALSAPVFVGWIAHFAVGIVLATFYIFWFRKRLWGSDAVRGMTFSLLPFALAQGVAIFGGGFNWLLLAGSLVGHLVYGLVLGIVTREKLDESMIL
jgi:hypothetical protein